MAANKVVISDEERDFIISCVQEDFRIDGRACADYRNIQVRQGVASNTHGSALVNLSKTQILVGIKAELQETETDSGRIEASVEFSGEALPGLDGRSEDLISELTSNIQRMINNAQLNPRALCIVPGKFCWVIYVDAVILQYDGNLLDALSVAVKAALEDVELPTLKVGKEGDKVDIEVSDDPFDTTPLDIKDIPLIVTLSKIGDRFAIDTCPEEESCVTAKVVVMVNLGSQICGIQKYGSEGLDPELLLEMIEFGKSAGKTLLNLTGIVKRK